MDTELARLASLQCVQRVMQDCERHLGISDRDLADFLIQLATTHPTQDALASALAAAEVECSPAFISALLRTVEAYAPSKRGGSAGAAGAKADTHDGAAGAATSAGAE
ncbi:hypothetical protein EON68_02775, partial [archaeon]